MRKITAAMLAAMLSAGMLTGCSIVPDGNSVEEPTPIEVTTATFAAETTQTSAENDTSAPKESAADAVCGKWEVQSVGENTVYAGQYGSEDYCRMFQMELFPDGTAEYYERGTAFCAAGTWSLADSALHLSFPGGGAAHLAPLNYLTPDADDGYTLTFADDTLTGEAEYLGALVFSRVDSFTERQYPDTAWLSGEWVCDTERSAADGHAGDLANIRWDVYTVEQSVLMSITTDDLVWDPYFGEIQPDGSFRLVVEYPEDRGYPFIDSVISHDGDEAEWKVDFLGYGTLYMKKVQ